MSYNASVTSDNTLTDRNLGTCIQGKSKPFPKEMQQYYIQAWREFQPNADVSIDLTVEGALTLARAADRGVGMHALITGSLHLAGSALRLLEPT